MPARNRVQLCLTDPEMAYIERIAKVRRTSISKTARLCLQAGMRNDSDGLSVLLRMDLAESGKRKAEFEEQLSKATKEYDLLVHDLEQIAEQESQAETTAPSRPISSPSPSIPATSDKKPARTAQEHWSTKVCYVLSTTSHLPREDLEKVERGVFEAATMHPDWLAALPEKDQLALREKMALRKGQK